MTQEEKAKAYDEALEKAKMVLQERGNEPDGASMLSNLFPELTESEDEKIRKDSIKYLDWEYHHLSNDIDRMKIEKCIAWLEKQGEKRPVNEDAEKEKYDYVSGHFLYCKGSFNEFKEGESYWLEYVGNDTYVGRSDNILNQKLHITPRQLYTWLDPRHPEQEQLVEQKPAWSEEDEKMIRALVSMCDVWATSHQFYPKENKEMEALKTWLKSLRPQSKQVLRDTFGYEDGRQFGKNEVLGNPEKYGLQRFVKWSKEDENVISLILSICNDFLESFKISPASTKVVKEDVDKIENWLKSLKDRCILQPKQEWSEEDELRIENLIAIIEGRGYPGEVIWLKNLKNRVQPQPKQEWSEEDKENFNLICFYLNSPELAGDKYSYLFNWLKSIKDRVQPQSKQKWGEEDEDMIERIISFVKPYTTYPSHEDIKYRGEMVQWLRDLKDKCLPLSKQEWSEEDEKMLTNAIAACNQCYFPTTAKWLKSLSPQKQWKPSEEQMNALKNVIDGYKSLEDKEGIKSLYEQLKAL